MTKDPSSEPCEVFRVCKACAFGVWEMIWNHHQLTSDPVSNTARFTQFTPRWESSTWQKSWGWQDLGIKNSWNGAFLIAKYWENMWEFPSLCPTIRAAASRKSCTIATLREPPTSQATAMDRARSTKSSYWTVTHGAVNAGQKHQGSHQNRSLQPLLTAKSNMWNASNQWKLVPKLQWAAIVGVLSRPQPIWGTSQNV